MARDHAAHTLAFVADAGDLLAQQQLAAQPFEQGDHAADKGIGPALGEPHPAQLFQTVDQRIDAAGLHRIAPDQQGMERQRLAQLVVLHKAGDHRIDRAPGLVLGQRGRGLEHRGKVQERNRPQLQVAFLVNALRIFQKPRISGDIRRIELGNFGIQFQFVVGIVKRRAIVPQQAIERMDRQQRHVVRHTAAGQGPQFFQAGRIR